VPVSASKGKHLQELLAEIKQHLPAGEPMFDPEDLTDRPVRFLATELIREKVFRLVGDELPYTSTVIIDKFEEGETLQRIFATVLVENDNQKAILIGAQGERMKRIASEARADLEKLLGSKVYLEVWVKVKSGWADTEASVRAYGYE
jgi:GTP-binding protein Era